MAEKLTEVRTLLDVIETGPDDHLALVVPDGPRLMPSRRGVPRGPGAGAVVELGRQRGVPVPALEVVGQLTRQLDIVAAAALDW